MADDWMNWCIFANHLINYTPMRHKLPPSCRHSQQFCEANGFCDKIQMKRMKTSERNNTLMSIIFHLFFLCSFLSFSCSRPQQPYDFHTSEEALDVYRAEKEKIQSLGTCNASQLVAVIDEWKEVSDTVYRFLESDPAFKAHVSLSLAFMEITDSIKVCLEQLGGNDGWNMKDLCVLKFSGDDARENRELVEVVEEAEGFYRGLDSLAVPELEKKEVRLKQYNAFLGKYENHEFASADDMKAFIAREDAYFQWFLQALPELGDSDLSPITRKTEAICRNIFQAAGQNRIEDRTALVYMSMRTNRRVISNARACAGYISKGRVKDDAQANAYLWMVVQPYLSIDSFSASLLTPDERSYLFSLAESYQRLAMLLHRKGLSDKEVTDVLPSRMVRLYLATL